MSAWIRRRAGGNEWPQEIAENASLLNRRLLQQNRHKADMPIALADDCFWGNSGHSAQRVLRGHDPSQSPAASEPTRLLSISYAVFCLKKKKKKTHKKQKKLYI